MSINTSALDRFRTDTDGSPAKRKRAKEKIEWTPPTREELREGSVLAFDQSLSATGLVALSNYGSDPKVIKSMTLRTKVADGVKKGPTEWLAQALELRMILLAELGLFGGSPWVIVNEAPPTGRNKMDRPESSLMAATVLHVVAHDLGYVVEPMIGVQRHKKITGGNHNAKKEDHHKVLKSYAGNLVSGFEQVTNPDERDAFSVALTYLFKGER